MCPPGTLPPLSRTSGCAIIKAMQEIDSDASPMGNPQPMHEVPDVRIPPRHFSEETIAALKELGAALDAVRRRLLSEGRVIQEDDDLRPHQRH
jgi:hypothetical protein